MPSRPPSRPNGSPARNRWLVVILLAAAVAGVAAGCGKGRTRPEDAQARPIPVQVAPAVRGPIENAVRIPGRIVANQEASLTARAPGRVVRVNASLGQAVRKGQVLVQLEASDLAAQASQARVAYDNAVANRERMRALFEEGAISRQQWELAELQATQAAAALEAARSALANASIVAPFDGYVTSVAVEEGETASPGLPLVTVVDPSRLFFEGSVSGTHAPRIAAGLDVRIESDSLPGVEIAGKVEAVSPAADSRRQTFPVRVAIPAPPPGLRAGVSARASIPLERRVDAVVVPLEAVLGHGAERYLYVVEGGVARRRAVEAGVSDGVRLEIRSGLREGERVVVAGQQYLRDGAPVRVTGGAAGSGGGPGSAGAGGTAGEPR